MSEDLPHESLPRDDSYDAALDEAIGEALEGQPRAAEWFELKRALEKRRALLQDELDIAEDEPMREKLRAAIVQADEHISVLGEEAEITSFIEDTVRFSSEVHRLQQGG